MTAPSLRTHARRVLRRARVHGRSVLVAVSGGGDSIALLHVLAALAAKEGFSLYAHGVDHGLRVEAAAELDCAEALAFQLGVPFSRSQVQLTPGANVQARAREARYRALEQARIETAADYLATAHHQRDRAETVLIRLLRGAPPAGLAVLPELDGRRLRPFVHAPQPLVPEYLERHQLSFAEDPSNQARRFLRSRVRHELLPLLRSLSPAIEQQLCSLAESLGRAPADDAEERALLHTLPRSTLEALRRLAAGESPRAHILLPGGLAVRADPPHAENDNPPTSPTPLTGAAPHSASSAGQSPTVRGFNGGSRPPPK